MTQENTFKVGMRVVAVKEIKDDTDGVVEAGTTGIVLSKVGSMIEIDFWGVAWGVYPAEIEAAPDQSGTIMDADTTQPDRKMDSERDVHMGMLRASQNIEFLRQHAIDYFSASLIADEIIEDLESERDELERKLHEAYAVLRFYADSTIYNSQSLPFYGHGASPIEEDSGKRARAIVGTPRKSAGKGA